MNRENLLEFLKSVKAGDIAPEDGLSLLNKLIFEDMGFARVDHHRRMRRGLPEVIFGEGKTPEQILAIASSLKETGGPVLITRLKSEKWLQIRDHAPYLTYFENARCAGFKPEAPNHPGNILICSGGTSDLPVLEEAAVTLEILGHTVTRISDIGVAGLHRVLAYLDDLQRADVVIAVAGMEGALPGVIAGITASPVIGVPTSVGYGAAFGGISSLLTMLNSCAGGVTVVNIDNGFGAAYAAALMVRRMHSLLRRNITGQG